MKKTVIIGIFTVSISTGCVRFSKEDTETNVTKESSNKVFKEWIGEKGIDSVKINTMKNNVKVYYHDNETILIKGNFKGEYNYSTENNSQIVDKTTKISMNILMFWSFFKKNKPYD